MGAIASGDNIDAMLDSVCRLPLYWAIPQALAGVVGRWWCHVAVGCRTRTAHAAGVGFWWCRRRQSLRRPPLLRRRLRQFQRDCQYRLRVDICVRTARNHNSTSQPSARPGLSPRTGSTSPPRPPADLVEASACHGFLTGRGVNDGIVDPSGGEARVAAAGAAGRGAGAGERARVRSAPVHRMGSCCSPQKPTNAA
jgi:hypothetical protein